MDIFSFQFEEVWWFIYTNLFVGKVAMAITTIFLFVAVYSFVRWRMIGLSMMMLSISLVVAYAGGFIAIFNGGVQ